MNKKIVGIFCCLIMSFLFFQPLVISDNTSFKKNFDEDVPNWEVGDKWSYKINEINIYLSENLAFINFKPSDLIIEVTDVTSNSYFVDFDFKLSGDIKINLPQEYGNGEIDLKFGGLFPISISRKIEYNKYDMGIKNIDSEISGVCKLKIKNNDFIPIPLSIPFRFNIKLDFDFSNPFSLISFPLAVEKYWGIHNTNLSFDGLIKSPWFRLLNFVHKIIRFINVIPEEYMYLSDMLVNILPVIDIKKTLSVFGKNNTFPMPSSNDPIFICIGYEQIIVQGNTLNCYNISLLDSGEGGMGNIYYSPDIGNIAKLYLNGNVLSPYLSSYLLGFGLPYEVVMSDINIEVLCIN